MDDSADVRLAHDERCNITLAESFHGALPPGPLDVSSIDLRAASTPAKRFKDTKATKRKGTADSYDYSPRISVAQLNSGYFIATKNSKRGRLQPQKDTRMDMHQSTCLNLSTGNDESDLWILPDFDEWELDPESPQEAPKKKDGEWAPLVERAVYSNRERLRRRLEGDGWDFVGGRYGEDYKALRGADAANEESVDEEFDVVVLPMVSVSC